MVNIIHLDVHFDDNRKITAVEVKLKACPEEEVNESSQHLVARVSSAFYAMDFFSDYGKTIKTTLNPKRTDVVDILVTLKENNLNLQNISKYVEEFQEKLDSSPF